MAIHRRQGPQCSIRRFLRSGLLAIGVGFTFSSLVSQAEIASQITEPKMARAPSHENSEAAKRMMLEQLSFYERRPNWRQRLGLERQVWVEVDQKDHGESDEVMQLNLRGVGAVKVPTERVYRDIQNFERLSQVSDYFKKVVWNQEKSELYIEVEALGYQSKFVMDVTKDDLNKRLNLYVREGSFAGMQAVIEVKEFERRHSLIVMSASLMRSSFGWPRGVVAFGLEALSEKVAQKMRSYLEAEFKK